MMTVDFSSKKGSKGSRGEASLFDRWLQSRLQGLYDEALDEPVPNELTQLLPDGKEPRGH